MDRWDWWIIFYPSVSGHRSSQGRGFFYPSILYIVFFLSCCNRNLLFDYTIRDYTRM